MRNKRHAPELETCPDGVEIRDWVHAIRSREEYAELAASIRGTHDNLHRYPEKEELTREWAQLPHTTHPLSLRVPPERGNFYYGRYTDERMFPQFAYVTNPYHEYRDACINLYENERIRNARLRNGSVEYSGDDVTIRLGIRRHRGTVHERDIAMGVYLHQFQSDEWNARVADHTFYPRYVLPQVRDMQTSDPFEWAKNRVEVVNGYACMEGASRDFPPQFAEYAYTRMASQVCNTVPESFAKPRHFHLENTDKEILRAVGHRLTRECPELVCFLVMNADLLDAAMLRNSAIQKLLHTFPALLENGLIVDRVSELFRELCAGGTPVPTALSFALQVTSDIYSGKERPWWFKEDFDLCEAMKGQDNATTINDLRPSAYDINNPDERSIVATIAHEAGFAFTYALEVYRQAGHKLLEIGTIDEARAVAFTVSVTKDYGIGNIARACNVIEFALELLRDTPEHEQESVLANFQEHIKDYRPRTPLIGAMEGNDVGFALPGLIAVTASMLGTKRIEEDKLDTISLRAEHIRALAAPLTRPLEERARTAPALAVTVRTSRLLATCIDDAHLLPVSHEIPMTHVTDRPMTGIFHFYSKLRRECGGLDDSIAEYYFAFYAPKMPDPFDPPAGFLHFLKKFRQIPDPEYVFPFMEHPADRARIIRNNQTRTIERHMVISNLLDAWIMGMIRLEEVLRVLDWVTVDAPEEVKKRYETEVDVEYARRKSTYSTGESDEEDSESRASFKIHDIHRLIDDHEGKVRLERLETLQKGMQMIAALNAMVVAGALRPSDISFFLSCQLQTWERPGASAFIPRLVNDNLLEEHGYTNMVEEIREVIASGCIDVPAFRDSLQSVTLTGKVLHTLN